MEITHMIFRNMLCYGADTVEIRFDDKEPDMTQILGKNGVGKSTFINLLRIGVYREFEGLTVDEVANQINKKGYLEIGCKSKGSTWRLVSEFSPNRLSVYKDGSEKPEDWGGISDTAVRIKKDVIDIPYYIFNNAISLSVNDFKSFMKMTPKDSRNIRDRIFGFTIINEMVDLLKQNLSTKLSESEAIEQKVSTITDSIVSSEVEYENLKKKIGEGNEKKIQELNESLSKTQKNCDELVIKLKDIDDNIAKGGMAIEYVSDVEFKEILSRAQIDLNKLDEERKKTSNEMDILKQDKNLMELEKTVLSLRSISDQLKIEENAKEEYERNLSEQKKTFTAITEAIEEARESLYGMKELVNKKELLTNFLIIVSKVNEAQQSYNLGMEEAVAVGGKLKDLQSKLEEGSSIITQGEEKKNNMLAKLKLFEDKKCGECESDLTTDEQLSRRDTIKADFEALTKKLEGNAIILEKLKRAIADTQSLAEQHRTKMNDRYASLKAFVPQLMQYQSIENCEVHCKSLIASISAMNNQTTVSVVDISSISSGFNNLINSIETKTATIEDDEKALDEKVKEYEELNKKLNEITIQINASKTKIDTLKAQIKENIDMETSVRYNDEKLYDENINTLNADINIKSTQILDCEKRYLKLESDIEALKKSVKPDNYFSQFIESGVELKDINKEVVEGNLQRMRKERDELVSGIRTMSEEITRLKINIDEISTGNTFKDQLQSVEAIVNKFRDELKEKSLELKRYKNTVTYYKMMQHILSDQGVKAFILKDIIPSINNEISSILSMLGVPITVIFDDEFKVHLYRFGKEVGLKSISTGQTKMIDCAILLAITKILKQKYPSINVIFYDEVFSSIDQDNRAILLEIFRNICCKQLKLHTFVINHSYLPASYFAYVLPVMHTNNFSHAKMITMDEFLQKMEGGQLEMKELTDNNKTTGKVDMEHMFFEEILK